MKMIYQHASNSVATTERNRQANQLKQNYEKEKRNPGVIR